MYMNGKQVNQITDSSLSGQSRMNLPKLKRMLTDPDEFISNRELKALSLKLLLLIPMPGIEG